MCGWSFLLLAPILAFYGWLYGRFTCLAADRLVKEILTGAGPKKER
ncbi:hypothetical protein MJO47_05050 [Desulfuromonas sp. KJ2020]|nr:hypothetical protein [Desulfuromonas sp. KJ2020]MCP3176462.1 hypothetical protein [Desulfuromonas sp. KJ2020]